MQEATQNLETLRANPYPGRGIVIGMDETGGYLVQVYWIMGRSENSRNRVFGAEAGHVWTEAADPSKVGDPSLIIYNAMRDLAGRYIVSNGDQTDTICEGFMTGMSIEQSLNVRAYEPDAPNYTPRISGVCTLRQGPPVAKLSVLKRSAFGDGCDRHFFRIETFGPGFGHCVTTYEGDGSPLPAFRGEPRVLPLPGDAESVATTIWDALNEDNRVSLAVKFIDIAGGLTQVHIVNKYGKVG